MKKPNVQLSSSASQNSNPRIAGISPTYQCQLNNTCDPEPEPEDAVNNELRNRLLDKSFMVMNDNQKEGELELEDAAKNELLLELLYKSFMIANDDEKEAEPELNHASKNELPHRLMDKSFMIMNDNQKEADQVKQKKDGVQLMGLLTSYQYQAKDNPSQVSSETSLGRHLKVEKLAKNDFLAKVKGSMTVYSLNCSYFDASNALQDEIDRKVQMIYNLNDVEFLDALVTKGYLKKSA